MRSILAAASIALLMILLALQATPSSAQKSMSVRPEEKSKGDPTAAAAKAKEGKATDNSYKSAIDRLPDQKYDPWRNMR